MTPEQQAAIERVEDLLDDPDAIDFDFGVIGKADLRVLVSLAKRSVREPSKSDVERVERFPGLRRVVHELRLSMGVFRDYGYQHQDKADAATTTKEHLDRARKAKRNHERAAACEDALNVFDAAGGIDELERLIAKRAVREPSEEETWHVARALSVPEHHTTWDMLSEQEKDLFFMQAGYGIKAWQECVE